MATFFELEQLYLAYFGRPPEPAALNYYKDFTVAQVEAAFEASPESRQVYAGSNGQADAAMVATAYEHLFNRTPSAAEVQYWVAEGASRDLTPSALSIVIATNALGGDNTVEANRIAYVKQWVDTFSDKATSVNYDVAAAAKLAMQELTGITADPASLTKAITATDIALTRGDSGGDTTSGGGAGGSTGSGPVSPVVNLTLTTAANDVVFGSSADETIHAITGAGATLNSGDTIDGQGGVDTLSVVNSNANNLGLSGVTNIEKLQLQTTTAAFSVDATGVTSLTDVVNDGSAQNVTASGLGNLVALAVQNTSHNTTLSFAGAALAATTDALELTLTNVTGGAQVKLLNANGGSNQLEELDIISNGTANSMMLATGATEASLTQLKISGAAPLTLAFGAGDASASTLATIDASAATGSVTIGSTTQGLGTLNSTITLGTGSNLVYMSSDLNSADSITATAGSNDTIAVSGTLASGDANVLVTGGVETVRFYGSVVQDMSVLSGISNFQMGGASSDLSLTKMANNAALEVLGGNSLTMRLATDGSTDALTLKFTPTGTQGASLGTLNNVTQLASGETLNLVSNAVPGQTSANTISSDLSLAKQVLTGSADFTITNALHTGNFDASAFTGKLTVTGQATVATTIKGGAGSDSITLGTAADIVTAGAGNDTIYTAALNTSSHASRGGDDITLGSGHDTVVFADNLLTGNGAASGYTPGAIGTAVIRDFTVDTANSSADKLVFSGNDASYQLTSAQGSGTASTGLAKGAAAHGLAAGDTMVVQTVATTGAVAAAADVSFFKLTGSADLLTSGSIAANMAAAMGTANITGLAANANYVISMLDAFEGHMTIAIVNTGANADGDTTLSAADFVSADIAVVGVLQMQTVDYTHFGADQLGIVL